MCSWHQNNVWQYATDTQYCSGRKTKTGVIYSLALEDVLVIIKVWSPNAQFMSTSELAPKQWIPRNPFDYKWTIVHYNLSPCWPRSISPYGFTRPQCVNHLCFVVKVWEILSSRYTWHDDVIKWKHFPRYWPLVRGIHRWIPRTKDGDAELWCFLWSTPE